METCRNSKLSVVVPFYNEAESLPELLQELRAALDPMDRPYELIFVDDGSTDDSASVLKGLCASDSDVRLFECRRNFGKSTALSVGFHHVTGGVIATLDADLQDDPKEIPRLLEKLNEGYDLVQGWKVKRMDPWTKRWPSRVFNAVTRCVSGLALHDFNCGLRVCRREVIEHVWLYGDLHRYLPAMAHGMGFRVTEQSVSHHSRRYGTSKFGAERFLRGFFDFMVVAFLIRFSQQPMHFFGRVGLALVAAGGAVCSYLTFLKFSGQFIALRPLLTLGVLLLILGFLFLATGFLGELIVFLHNGTRKAPEGHTVRSAWSGESAR
jgi:glycosyltransferase involved in cell wall biosynthesis